MTLPRHGLIALVSSALLIAVSVALLDRPWADFAHRVTHDLIGFRALTWIAEPMGPLAVLVLALAGLGALAGWRPGPWGRLLIAAALACVVAIEIKEQLKFAFGRTWPETWVNDNPSWIKDGVFGFTPFHGGPGWASFPSGHTTAIAAPCAVLWFGWRGLRVLWLALTLLVAIGLLGADYHWLSDVIAGAYLGLACGYGTWVLLSAPRVPPI